jgi:hypothetical protein
VIFDAGMCTNDWLALAYIESNQGIDLIGLAPCAYAASHATYSFGLSNRNKN